MMICADTIYFGVSDSVVILPANEKYQLKRNFLLRSNVYYEKRPKKKKQVEERMGLYYKMWQDAYVRDSKEKEFVVSQHYFEQFKGKVIRNIEFEQIDIFNGEIRDTAKYSLSTLGRNLKENHTSTRVQVLRNNLRFEENETINPWKIAENERLLRQLIYIEDARIIVSQDNLLSDSVDLKIVTKDRFPYDISIKASGTDEFSISPSMRNFLGLGHYVELGAHHKLNEEPVLGYSFKYLANNLGGSFIDVGVSRTNNFEKDNYGVIVERPFITNDMEIGGAISYESKKEILKHEYDTFDSVFQTPYHSTIFDGWIGKTFLFSSSGNRPNLSIATRLYYVNYLDRPFVSKDSNLIFHDSNLSLSSIMLQKVNFFQAHKVQGFGVTEDIPVGYSIMATGGYSRSEYFKRPYIGVDFSMQGVRPRKGLLGISIEAASFYNSGAVEDVFGRLSTSYVSPLQKKNRIEMRHFFIVNAVTLHNRRYYRQLRFGNDIIEYNDHKLKGNSYLSVQYRPTFHLPYKFVGFNFALTPFTDVGIISNNDFLEGSKDFVSAHGFTIRIKNESLVIPAFGIDFKYYPKYNRDKGNFAVNIYFRDSSVLTDLFSPKPKLIR